MRNKNFFIVFEGMKVQENPQSKSYLEFKKLNCQQF